MENIVIVGAGGFGREVLWLLERINAEAPSWNIIGFVDDTMAVGTMVDEHPVISDILTLAGSAQTTNVVVAVGASCGRKKVCEVLSKNINMVFPNIVDPSVLMSERVTLGHGNIMCAASVLTVDIVFGDFNVISVDCTVGHDAVFESYVTLYPSVNISGNTVLESCVEIGTGSQIIQKKRIGHDVIVGAGAVVVKDLPKGCTAVGVPAKPIKFHSEV